MGLHLRWMTLFLGVLISLASFGQSLNDYRSNVTTGNWNALGSWQRYNGTDWVAATALPGATVNNGNVLIRDGHTITVTAAPTNAISSLTVGEGDSGSLNIGAFAVTVTGAVSISAGASLTKTSATGTLTFNSNFTNDGTYTMTGSQAVTINGSITNNGTFTSGGGTYTLNANGARTISGDMTFSGSVTLSVAGGNYTSTGTIPVAGTLTLSTTTSVYNNEGTMTVGTLAYVSTTYAAGRVFNNYGTLTINTSITPASGGGQFFNRTDATATYLGTGAIGIQGFNVNEPDNTFIYGNTSSAQTVRGTTYHNLHIDKADGVTATLSAAATINGNFLINTGIFVNSNIIITGNATGTWSLGPNAVYRTTRGNATPWLPTNFVAANVSLDATSEIDFAGSIGINFTTDAFDQINNTFPGLRISGSGTRTLAVPISVGNLTITSGALDDGGNQITGSATGSLAITGTATLFLGSTTVATVFPTNYVTANISIAAAAIVNYKSNQPQLISNEPVYGVLQTSSTGAVVKTLAGETYAARIINASNNTLELGNFDVYLNGGTTPVTNSGTIAAGSTGSANLILTGNATMSSITNGGTFNPRFNLIIDNTIAAGVSMGGSGFTVHNVTINSGCQLNLGAQTLPFSGTFTNNGSLNSPTNTGRLLLDGTSAQNLDAGNLTTGFLAGLTINNPAGVTLLAPLTIGIGTAGTTNLNLLSGILTTSASATLTLNTASTLGGGSNSSYVDGPVRRIYPTGTSTQAAIPIGSAGVYTPVALNSVNSVGGATTLEFEVLPGALPGTLFPGLSDLNASRHWSIAAIGTNLVQSYILAITETGSSFNASTRLVRNDAGLIVPGTSSGSGATVTGTAGAFSNDFGLFSMAQANPLNSGTYAVGPTGDFQKLYQVALALNGLGVNGPVVFEMQPAYDGTIGEVYPIIFNQYSGGSSTNTATIRPALGATNLQTTGSINGALIEFNGADWITFDGRPNGAGISREWTFDNSFYTLNQSPNTFRFINAAQNNTLTYLNIRGSGSGLAPNSDGGAIHFGTSTGGGGQTGNTVSFCTIAPSTGGPLNTAITSSGSASNLNGNITISNNLIYDFFEPSGKESRAIRLNINNGSWTITDNSFYQTEARAFPSGFGYAIISMGSGTGHTISNNYFGGTEPQCGGTAWTTTGPSGAYFRGIIMESTTAGTPASTVSDNVIANFNHTTGSGVALQGASWAGIQYSPASSGNQISITGNTIGSTSANGNIVVDISANTAEIRSVGIIVTQATNGGSPTISNNTIAGIRTTVTSSGQPGHSFAGIFLGTGAGTWTVTGNTVGSELANSISTDFTMPLNNSSQTLWGIYSSTSGTANINNNVIRNLTNYSISTTAGSTAIGINIEGGLNNIINNTIYGLTANSRSANTTTNSPLVGIRIVSTLTAGQILRGNTIYDLRAVTTNPVSLHSYGIYYQGPTSGTAHRIEQNIIHSIRNDATGAGAAVYGVYVVSGNLPLTIQNNMVRLGIDADGVSLGGSAEYSGIVLQSTNTVPVIYNSVYIGGADVDGAQNSFAFRRLSTAGVHTIRNNIFENARSNGSGTGTHYAMGYAGFSNTFSDNNILSAQGNGGAIGLGVSTTYVDICDWIAGVNQDANSINYIGGFIDPTGDAASVNLKLQASNAAEGRADNTGITPPATDQEGDTRSGVMDIGADEGDFTLIGVAVSATVTVGTGGTYPTLTGACGLFNSLNQAVLSGNVVATVISDITEPGTFALNQWMETGAGNYTLTIQSDGDVRALTGNYNGAATATAGLIRFNGADRVTISGGSGTERNLILRNINAGTNAGVIQFQNDASDNQINNCSLEGAHNNNATAGVIFIGSGLTGGTGNDNIIITNNDIRDRSDINATDRPNSGVVGAGLSTLVVNNNVQITDNTFINIYRSGTRSSSVVAGAWCQGWTISGNNFLMGAQPSVSAGTENWVVYLNSGAIGGHVVDNNLFEGWTMGGGVTYRFVGIFNQTTGTTAGTGVSITDNTIRNITITSTTGSTANYGVFSGIYFASGYGTVTGNTIGSLSENDNITVTSSTNGVQVWGIRSISTGSGATGNNAMLVANNTIAGISMIASGSTIGGFLEGISTTAGGMTIQDNIFGGTSDGELRAHTTQSNSSGSTRVAGIYISASSSYNYIITGNTARNLISTNTASASAAYGIYGSGGALFDISNNTVHSISTAGSSNGSGTNAVLIGIGIGSANAGGHRIEGNTVYNLVCNTAASTTNSVVGILYAGSLGSIANVQVTRNTIHSLNNFSQESISPYGQIFGILIPASTGVVTVSNNMIHLGFDLAGDAIPRALSIGGIEKQSTSQANIYHNSVYIGGLVTSTTPARTAAFRRTATSASDRIQNNIFVNERSTNTAGVIRHFATILNATSLAAMNNNLYYVSGVLSNLFSNDGGSTGITTLAGLQASIAGQNTASAVANTSQINFVNTSGAGLTLDLRLNAATVAAGTGASGTGVTTDIDGTVTRPAPPSIGAHEGEFDPLGPDTDIFPPTISVASIPTVAAVCGSEQTISINATVIDVTSGVASGGLSPTLWWRISTGTWASLPPSGQSGDVYNYQLNLTGITAGQIYQYYVAAQDMATVPNIAYSHFNATTPVHDDVATFPTTPNGAPASFTISSSNPMVGVIIVGGSPGPGETTGVNHFTTFSRFDGFFRGVFDRGLAGDVTVLVRANITTEDGNFSLNNWQEFCGSGHSITVRPETASLKSISGSLLGMGMLMIQASRVHFDGRFNGEGDDRFLRFENTYSGTGGSENNTFKLAGSGSINTVSIRNCEIVGSSTKVAGAVLYIASGSSNVTIENNIIRGGSSYAVNCIRSDGSNAITIKDNEISNFFSWSSAERARGVFVTSSGGGSNWTITGNSFFNTFINGTSATTALTFIPGASSNNNLISGNFIGGSAPQCGGDFFFRNNTNSDFIMLEVNCGNSAESPTVISNNTITRVHAQSGDAGGVTCIMVRGSSRVEIVNNTIGDLELVNQIQSNGGGISLSSNTGWVYGIDAQTSSPILIDGNLIGGLAAVGSFRSYGNSIELWGSGTATVRNNTIVNSYNGASNSGFNYYGIAFTGTGNANHIVERNTIYYLGSASGSLSGNYATGMLFNGNNQGARIEGNELRDFFHVANGGESHGIHLVGSNANYTVVNNMISMNNRSWLGNYTTRKIMSGIYDWTTTGTVNVHHNTVIVQGSQTGTAGFDYPSAAYFRFPSGSGSGSGSTTNLRNNVFINTRTGAPTANSLHYAIDNTSTSPSVGWSSDYNFLFNLEPNNLGWWGGSGGNRTFTTWQSSSGGDANSYTATSTGGASNFGSGLLNVSDLFMDPITDLRISIADNQSNLFLESRGTPVITTPTDIDGDSRNALTPDIGADEFGACEDVAIAAQPTTPEAVCDGEGLATISVSATGNGLQYQWRRNGQDLSNTAPYSGVNSATLTITNATAAHAGSFDVVISGDCGDPQTSSAVTLTVTPAPTWYLDADEDGFAVSTTQACSSPGSGYTLTVLPLGDCNDNDPVINPNTVWYLDADGDGVAVSTLTQCANPGTGYTTTVLPLGDCNDNNPAQTFDCGVCTGIPAPGGTTTTMSVVCPGVPFTLGTSNALVGSNLSYVWQVGNTSVGPWTTFATGPSPTVTVSSISMTRWYRVRVNCLASGQTGVATSVQVAVAPNCGPIPELPSEGDTDILSVTINGNYRNTDCAILAPGPGSIQGVYGNYITSPSISTVIKGASASFDVEVGSCGPNFNPSRLAIYVDFNQNGVLEASEKVYEEAFESTGPNVRSGSFEVPLAAVNGQALMRLILAEGVVGPITPSTTFAQGEVEDHLVTIINPPIANDYQATATLITPVQFPNCSSPLTVNLAQATPSPETGLPGNTAWYRFTPTTVGAVITVTGTNDVLVQLHDSNGLLLTENAVTANGNETLIYGNYATGQTYWIAIIAQSTPTSVSICISQLRRSTCDNPTSFNSPCLQFKNTFTSASAYDVYFDDDGQLPYIASSSTTGGGNLHLLSNFIGLPPMTSTTNYLVRVDATYYLQNAAGTPVVVTIPGVFNCTRTLNAHPNVFLRDSDASPNVRPANAQIAAQQWVCATFYEWSLQQYNAINGSPIAPFATLVNGPAGSRFLNIGPLGLVPNGVYRVNIRPHFSGGPGNLGPNRWLLIAGPAGLTLGDEHVSATDNEAHAPVVYPNPTRGDRVWLNWTRSEESTVRWTIIDASGRIIVRDTRVMASGQTELVFPDKLAVGVYYLELLDGDQQHTLRVVVN